MLTSGSVAVLQTHRDVRSSERLRYRRPVPQLLSCAAAASWSRCQSTEHKHYNTSDDGRSASAASAAGFALPNDDRLQRSQLSQRRITLSAALAVVYGPKYQTRGRNI